MSGSDVTTGIIKCARLMKQFGSHVALAPCDLSIFEGRITGLLGPNGAGKTTLLRTLLGFQRPTSGSATVCGFDCVHQTLQVRRQVAYLPGEARLFRSMTGTAVLDIFSGLSPSGDSRRCRAVADRLELDLSRRVMFMSTGMRQKLALSIVLGSTAPLVILDEPTANLDPTVRNEVMLLVREAFARGQTILLSSHIFSDIDDTCHEVVILRQGQVVHREPLTDSLQLHLVRASTGKSSDVTSRSKEGILQSLGWNEPAPEFLRFLSVKDSQSPSDTDICMQLSGDPQHWLAWISSLSLTNLSIERAGVRAIYERFHS